VGKTSRLSPGIRGASLGSGTNRRSWVQPRQHLLVGDVASYDRSSTSAWPRRAWLPRLGSAAWATPRRPWAWGESGGSRVGLGSTGSSGRLTAEQASAGVEGVLAATSSWPRRLVEEGSPLASAPFSGAWKHRLVGGPLIAVCPPGVTLGDEHCVVPTSGDRTDYRRRARGCSRLKGPSPAHIPRPLQTRTPGQDQRPKHARMRLA